MVPGVGSQVLKWIPGIESVPSSTFLYAFLLAGMATSDPLILASRRSIGTQPSRSALLSRRSCSCCSVFMLIPEELLLNLRFFACRAPFAYTHTQAWPTAHTGYITAIYHDRLFLSFCLWALRKLQASPFASVCLPTCSPPEVGLLPSGGQDCSAGMGSLHAWSLQGL